MTPIAPAHQHEFSASMAQLEGRSAELPAEVAAAVGSAVLSGWVIRMGKGSARRMRFWLGGGSVVAVADLDDPDQITPAVHCTGRAAVAHLIGALVPGELGSPGAAWPEGTAEELFDAVVGGDGSVALGMLFLDGAPERQVIVRSGADLRIGTVSGPDDLLTLRPLALAGLWATMTQLVSG